MKTLMKMAVWCLELIVAIAFFLICLIAILPWLLSVEGTRSLILTMASRASGQQISVQQASLTWFGTQMIRGLSVQDPVRNVNFCIDEITTQASLWQILITTHNIGLVHISRPYLAVLATEPALSQSSEKTKRSQLNLQSAGFSYPLGDALLKTHFFEEKGQASPCLGILGLTDFCYSKNRVARLFSGQILAEDGTVEVTGPHIDTVFFRNISLEADLKKAGEALSFRIRGDTLQKSLKDEITGNFFLNGTLSPCENTQGEKLPNNVVLQGGIARLPVLGVDQILSLVRPEMQGLLPLALGSMMDLTGSALLSPDKGEFAFTLSSTQMKATLYATTQEGKIVLRSPATCTLAVTPGLITFLLADYPLLSHLKLSSSAQLDMTVKSLNVPFYDTTIDWNKLNMDADLRLSNTSLDTPALSHRIDLKEIQATVTIPELQKELLVDAHMKLQYAGVSSSVASVAQIKTPVDHPAFKTWTLSADKFPVPFIDHLLMSQGSFSAILGDAVNLNFALEPEGERLLGTLYLSTPQLVIEGAVLSIEPHIQLEKPLDVFFRPTDAWLQRYLPRSTVTPIKLSVQEFSLGNSLSTLSMRMEAKADALNFDNYGIIHPQALIDVKGSEHIAVKLQAEGISGEAHLRYDQDKKILSSQETTKIAINLQPSAWTPFSSWLIKPTRLIKPASVILELHPFSFFLNKQKMTTSTLDGTFQIVDLLLTSPAKPNSRFAIKDTSFHWKLDNEKQEFSARGEGQIAGVSQAWSPFFLETLFRNLHEPTSDRIVKCAVSALDTSALDLWIDSSHSLVSLLGSPLNLKLDIMDKVATSALTIDAKSDRLQLYCGLAWESDELVLRSSRQPIVVNWTISPEGFALGADLWEKTFHEPCPLVLTKPTPLSLRVDTLALPLEKNSYTLAPNFLEKGLISGTLSIERAPFVQLRTEEPITFQHVQLQIQRQSPETPLQFYLKSAVEAAKPGLAELQGSIQAGKDLRTKLEANFQNIPTAVPDLVATLAGLQPHTLTTIFGSSITGSLQADIEASSGPISMQINSPSTRVHLNGVLKKGVLTLQEPFVAQATLTKDFSRSLLEQTNPLSLDIVTSEGPITLTIDKEGFAFPLFPWDLPRATIGHARIDLGRITCHNQGNINDLLGLLKQGQFSRNQDLKLWFAPMDLSLKNGIIDCERTEILVADKLDICTWGEVDLNKNRVDAILGLTAPALQIAFGIKNLPPDYVLQLPMKGPIGNVKINTKAATAKIALLLASQQTGKSGGLLGGSKGAIVGGLLGGLATLPDYNSPAPPAKRPFPWEAEYDRSSRKTSKKKTKAAIKPGDRPLKQLVKLFKQ